MIEQIEGLPAGTLGFRARGQVTAADYERVIVPDVEAAFALNRKLRVLYITAEDFTGFDLRQEPVECFIRLRPGVGIPVEVFTGCGVCHTGVYSQSGAGYIRASFDQRE